MNKAAALLALLIAVFTTQAQTIQVSKDNRTIAITTTDDASATADTAHVGVGFTAYGSDSDATYADSSRISNAIISALHSAGIKDAQISSKNQNLQPLNEEDKIRFGKGVRFQFNQNWQVTVPAADAAKTLHIAITAGANNSGDITWTLANMKALDAEAAEKALAQARTIAESMARGLNAKLGSLVYASNQVPPRFPFGVALQTENASVASRMLKAAPLAIVPDQVTRTATVYAIFAIE